MPKERTHEWDDVYFWPNRKNIAFPNDRWPKPGVITRRLRVLGRSVRRGRLLLDDNALSFVPYGLLKRNRGEFRIRTERIRKCNGTHEQLTVFWWDTDGEPRVCGFYPKTGRSGRPGRANRADSVYSVVSAIDRSIDSRYVEAALIDPPLTGNELREAIAATWGVPAGSTVLREPVLEQDAQLEYSTKPPEQRTVGSRLEVVPLVLGPDNEIRGVLATSTLRPAWLSESLPEPEAEFARRLAAAANSMVWVPLFGMGMYLVRADPTGGLWWDHRATIQNTMAGELSIGYRTTQGVTAGITAWTRGETTTWVSVEIPAPPTEIDIEAVVEAISGAYLIDPRRAEVVQTDTESTQQMRTRIAIRYPYEWPWHDEETGNARHTVALDTVEQLTGRKCQILHFYGRDY